MFVTIRLEPRRPLFGHVNRERVLLSEAGEIAKRDLLEAAGRFKGFITLRAWTIMPDHVHLRFTWPSGNTNAAKMIGSFIGRFKQFSKHHISWLREGIWEEGYHSLICAAERLNRTVDAYILNNPRKRSLLHGDPSLMRVVEPFPLLEDGGHDLWRAVGNTDLLKRDRIVSLRISRKVSLDALPQIVETCRRDVVENGYPVASTFFSPGERMVFKALAAEKDLSIIRLLPTFTELAYRPHGLEPSLFAEKRLLILSRMVDPAAPTTPGELVRLNFIAANIARASEGGRTVYVTIPGKDRNQVVYEEHPMSP